MTDVESVARGYAVARYTGASTRLGLFEIDGDQMRSAEPFHGLAKWGYCNRAGLISPVFPTLAEARDYLKGQNDDA